jgi:hypothetical protein
MLLNVFITIINIMSLYSFTNFVECNFHPTTCESISSSVSCVILHSKFVEKSQNMLVWLKKIILAQHKCKVWNGYGRKHSNVMHLHKKCKKYHSTAAQCFLLAYHND